MTGAPPGGFAGRVLSDRLCELGEGAVYDPMNDKAWWFDILGRKLVSYAFQSGALTVSDLPMMASAMALIDKDRHLIVNEDGLCVREIRTGAMARYLDIESDDPATRSNDARVHPCGALWVGTMGKRAEDAAGSIYHVFKGRLRRLYGDISVPNAICFSPDGTLGYFADTRKGKVLRVPLDPATGLPAGEPGVFLPEGSTPGSPDGAIVDADGNFINARWDAGAVDIHAPDGSHVRTLSVPARRVTCPAFVGHAADRLVVTSAYEGLDEAGRTADPLAGATFLLDLPVNGRHEPRMIL